MTKIKNLPSCCQPIKKNSRQGLVNGLLAGIFPHTFCILFIVFSVLGATSATFLFKGLLLNKNFFYFLILLSFVFASLSAIIYLKRNGMLSFDGVKHFWEYLSILYGSTIAINLLLFLVIFPATANFHNTNQQFSNLTMRQSLLTLKVSIPCSGHASLITSELKKLPGINEIKFRLPNLFDVNYNGKQVTIEQILNISVFKTYKAEITKN